MSESIEKKLLLGNLYDYYARLLTEKQREILDQYCMDDLSLVEISSITAILTAIVAIVNILKL